MAKSYVLEVGSLDARDIANFRVDPNFSLYRIPFGVNVGKVTVKRAAPWKGKGISAMSKMGPKALEFAIKVSRTFAGIKGTVTIGGVPYPAKSIAQRRWRDNAYLKGEYEASGLANAETNLKKRRYPAVTVEQALARSSIPAPAT